MNDKSISQPSNGATPRKLSQTEMSTPRTAPSLSLGNIYYILFRHKWKIAIISAAGLLIAFILPFVIPVNYESEAKLFIRYVVETKSPGQLTGGDRMKSPDESGENIINTELEILTSLDLAQKVADAVGPEKILAKAGGGKDRAKAANLIHRGLTVDVPRKSNVIRLTFQHPDETLVQSLLGELVEIYFKRHAEIHRAIGVFDDFLTQETDQLRSRLVQTENALRAAKTNAGITSLEEARRSQGEWMSKIRLEILEAEAEWAERSATVAQLSKLFQTQPETATNAVAGNLVPPSSDTVADYKRLSSTLDALHKREQELALQFTDGSSFVKSVSEQIAKNQARKSQMEKENPGLLAIPVDDRKANNTNLDPRMNLSVEIARVNALASRIHVLTNQLAQVRKDAAAVDGMEGSITELQRKKELEEANYKYFSANLEQSRIDEALGAGRVSNISKIQAPSPPLRAQTKLKKMMAGAFFGAIAAALALAFVIESFFDRSLRRPQEIEDHLQLPLFLSIPRMHLTGKSHALKSARKAPLLSPATDPQIQSAAEFHSAVGTPPPTPAIHHPLTPVPSHRNGSVAPWDSRHALRPFYETLRDRLIAYFEAINLTHKPKLVAVTSCAVGSGVTTTAAGLAACLSETGEGNVLLVDMNLQQGEAHHFYKGHHLACGLDDALEGDKRESALVQANLYVVTEGNDGNGDKLPKIMPERFKHLIPKLRASDYDYIIFDMPPVSQISATPRLARFMDMVFLVIESEKTDRDLVKRAADLLAASRGNVGVILNKSTAYVPKRLQQDI